MVIFFIIFRRVKDTFHVVYKLINLNIHCDGNTSFRQTGTYKPRVFS